MRASPFNSYYNEGPTSATFIVEVESRILGEFREVKGLGGKVEVFEVIEGGENNFVHKLPGRFTFDDVTLRRGVTFDNGLYDWFNEASGSRFEQGSKNGKSTLIRQDVTITLMSADRKRLRTWTLNDAIPVSWSGPDLTIETDDFLIEEITLAHHGLVVKNLGQPAPPSAKPNIQSSKKSSLAKPTNKPNIKATAKKSNVASLNKKPSIKATAKKSNVASLNKKPSIKATAKKSNRSKPDKKPNIKATAKKSNYDLLKKGLKVAKEVVKTTKDAAQAAQAIKDLSK